MNNRDHRQLYFLSTWILLVVLIWLALPRPLFDTPYSWVVQDHEGRLLAARIADDGQWRFPVPDSLPQNYVTALTTFEDQRFFWHGGVDLLAVGRAVWQNLRARRTVSGGSTISMQTIRLAQKNPPRTLLRKAWECLLALRLESSYSKHEILRQYAGHAPFGGNTVGIEAATWRYFGKAPRQLSWAEAALLAVLPNSPALIHPGRNRELLLQKRNRLLRQLHQNGALDSLSAELAITEPLPGPPRDLPRLAPQLLDRYVLGDLTHQGEQRIQSTIDARLQVQTQAVLQRWQRQFSGRQIHNAAALIVHLPSATVRSYQGNVAGIGAEHHEAVDLIMARRSSGSILKPFLHALALQEGSLLPTQLLPDIPSNFGRYRPENYDEDYRGAVPAREALRRSLNIPFVHLLYDYGLQRAHYQLQRLGMRTLDQPADHYGLTLIVGGAETSLWDLGQMYTWMGQRLQGIPLQLLRTSGPGQPAGPLLDSYPLDAGSIWNTVEAMQELERPNTEGTWQAFRNSRRIAWKTGTSYGFRDAWAVGFDSEYLIAVWAGNADGEGRPGIVGVQAAAPILFELFDLLPAAAELQAPLDALKYRTVCSRSGYLAGPNCSRDTLLAADVPTKGIPCPYHRPLYISEDGTYRLQADCGALQRPPTNWFSLPPLQAYYYQRWQPTYRTLPPLHPDCQGSEQEQVMQLIYPRRVSSIQVPVDLDGHRSRTVFSVAHERPQAVLHWHLDDRYLGSTRDFHSYELDPEPGKHQLTLVDDQGNRLVMPFEIYIKKAATTGREDPM